MAKKSQANNLPRIVLKDLETMGEQIKLARKRRKLSLAELAERAQCSVLTLMRVEKGEPTVSIGIYARVLYGLGLHGDLMHIAENDKTGILITENEIMKRNQRKEEYVDFD